MKFKNERVSCFQQEPFSSFGVMDRHEQLSGCRWRFLEGPVLQLQRRQGQVRHEVAQQCQRELWFRVGFPSEASLY